MTAPLWQILVVTLASRRHFLARMREKLQPQVDALPDVELVTLEDDGERSIGEKRQAMLEASTSPWVCFFDDDDVSSDDYVARIRPALNDQTDVVGFKLRYIQDGRERGVAVHSYDAANIPVGPLSRRMTKMCRLPNHLNPVRRDLALQVGYKPRNAGEDSAYAIGLSQLRPRPRETFIDAEVYTYLYRSTARRPRDEVLTTNESRVKRGEIPAVAR